MTPTEFETTDHKSNESLGSDLLEKKNQLFPTTKWNVVHELQKDPESEKALDSLCNDYWKPVYAVLRRTFTHEEAQDVAQEFFLKRILGLKPFLMANPEKGKLRGLILRVLKWHTDTYLRNHAYSDIHGARTEHVPIDSLDVPMEDQLVMNDPGRYHETDLDWAKEAHRAVMALLKDEYVSGGKESIYEVLAWRVEDSSRVKYEEDAGRLGVPVEGARVLVYRMRERYRTLAKQFAKALLGESGAEMV